MKERIEFRKRMDKLLSKMDQEALAYDESEYWMIQSPFEYIEFYAIQNMLKNTYIALHLSRGLHDGVHRKSSILRDGVSYLLPYAIHPLFVTRMLVDLHIPISHDDEDILLAAALCHDMIEDVNFSDGGKELYTKYHLDPKVYEIVKCVSKRYDFTEQEERDFFHNIESNELALLIKLSDRGHNVEDLYNMRVSKVHEYIQETDKFFIPMCNYALDHYPKRINTFTILKDKIVTLTNIAQILVDRYFQKEQELQEQISILRKENDELRKAFRKIWE